jgi:hypothetical protein
MMPRQIARRLIQVALVKLTLAATAGSLAAQAAPNNGADAPPGILPGVKMGGSANIHVVAHVPLGGSVRVMDNEIEQDPARPYAYVSMAQDRSGFAILDLRDLDNVRVLYRWTIENVALHRGLLGGMDGKYFKIQNRYYYLQSFGFSQGTPDGDLGAVIADVTGLPDTSKVKIVARVRAPETPTGFHNTFVYRHSDGRVLLFATVTAPRANVYDLSKVVAGGDSTTWQVGEVPVPDTRETTVLGRMGYHDFYVAYDPATHQDKFYGAGRGGYYVYDITDLAHPKLLTSVTGSSGVDWGHTFTPSPDGRFAVTETEYQFAPLRVYDLQPGLEGKVQTINHPIGAWNADWHDLSHNHEVRWPFVFVSGYEDGLQVFSMTDPAHPTEVAWYYTCACSHQNRIGGPAFMNPQSVDQGAFGIDVRNRDGLIMISDENTGVWFFRMDGFAGWNGRDWGMPNISSVQDYDHGPDGATAIGRPTE